MVNLADILHIVSMIHVWKWLHKVSELRVFLFEAKLVKLFDEWLLNLDLLRRCVTIASALPKSLAFRTDHLSV